MEAGLARGLAVDDFAPRLSFFFNSHSDFFEEVAKFRASRRIWWRLMSERYGARNERSTWMRFHTQTAGVSLTPQQPLNNLTRVATQALAAVLGRHPEPSHGCLRRGTRGANGGGRAPRPPPAAGDRRGVRRRQHGRPAGWIVVRGGAHEQRPRRRPGALFDEIDARGGMVAAVEAGYPQREIADAAYRYQRELEAGERVVVGVNRHVDASETLRVPVLQVPVGSLARQLARLERTRRERDAAAVEAALAGLRDAATRPESSATNLMPHFIRCAEAYATLGEQCAVLRDVSASTGSPSRPDDQPVPRRPRADPTLATDPDPGHRPDPFTRRPPPCQA